MCVSVCSGGGKGEVGGRGDFDGVYAYSRFCDAFTYFPVWQLEDVVGCFALLCSFL